MMDHCIPNSIYTLPLLMLFLQNFSFKKSLSYSVASILISRFFQEQTLSTRVQFFFMEPNDQIIAHLPSIHSLPTPFYAQLLVFFLNADLIISLLSSNTFRRIFFFPRQAFSAIHGLVPVTQNASIPLSPTTLLLLLLSRFSRV